MLISWLREVWLDDDLSDADFAFYSIAAAVFVIMAGLMSGLTLGLMSLDEVDLEILRRSGNPRQKAHAERIMPVIAHQHRLLVTLLLWNAAAAEALPLCLDRLADPITAILVSVTVVLFFGEIIPQAACSQYGLQIGAVSAPFVRALMFISYPISGPIAWILDNAIGHRRTALFKRGELKALVDIHGEEAGGRHALTPDEVKVIKGALDLTNKRAKTAMTPLDLVFMLSADAVLDEERLTEVLASGHSRIPVHKPGDRRSILGILLVKELILVDPNSGITVSQMKIRSLPHLLAETPMYDMLKLFEIGRSHMAVLTKPTQEALTKRGQKLEELAIDVYSMDDSYSEDEYEGDRDRYDGYNSSAASSSSSRGHSPGHGSHHRHRHASSSAFLHDFEPHELEPVGIITIEDVLEELLGSEIVDETDQWVDNLRSTRVNAAMLAGSLPDHLRRVVMSGTLLPRIGNAGVMQPGFSGRQARTSLDEMDSSGGERDAYSNLRRVMMPSRPRPKSVAGQIQQQQQQQAVTAAARPVVVVPTDGSSRRNVNLRSGVQQQIDLLEPLLARRRFASEAIVANDPHQEFEDVESGSKLVRQNSV